MRAVGGKAFQGKTSEELANNQAYYDMLLQPDIDKVHR